MIVTDRDIDAEEYLALIGRQESQEIQSASSYLGQLVDRCLDGNAPKGPALPWNKTHDAIRFNPGQLSIWAGVNGHGKSLVLSQVILWWLRSQKALIASLEMKPVETLYRMARQMRGGLFDHTYMMDFCESLTGRLWIYDQLDSVAPERILGLIHYAANEMHVDHVVIDSLTKCGLTRDDYAQQAKFVDRVQWAAKRHNVHVHLVCHMRKGDTENTRPGKFDIRGAAEISDLADNVLVIHRNKAKEEAKLKRMNGAPLTKLEEAELSKPDSTLRVDKNRHMSHEGSYALWYHHGAMQFLGSDVPYAMNWEE